MGIPVNDKVTPWPLETSFGVICHFIYKKFGNPSIEIDDEILVIQTSLLFEMYLPDFLPLKYLPNLQCLNSDKDRKSSINL